MRVTSTFTGGLRFESEIRQHKIVVDNPVESGGEDTGPTPPELLATALGTCVGIYAVNFCKRHDISPAGMTIHTEGEKVMDPPRIGSLTVRISLPAGVPEALQGAFIRTVEKCMVHNTLSHNPTISITLDI